jgi:hypothetical protein
MDEIEWFGGSDPSPMLEFLRGQVSDRKVRLFARACCGRIGHLFADAQDREVLAAIERFADGLATRSELRAIPSRTTNPALVAAAGAAVSRAAASTSAACASLIAAEHGDLGHPKGQGDYYAAEAGENV